MQFLQKMADSEKLTALKKAYADIILNTAKEAAARIMVSERKAERYQQELFAAKDEALRMLLRLKQMLDSKVNEAEKVYMNQQKRIEELEAQLGEAEDIVRDLRAELREAQDELERVAKEQMQNCDFRNSKDDEAAFVEKLQVHRINNFAPVVCSLPSEQSDTMTASDLKIPVQHATYMGNHCSCKDNCYVYNPDFASIVMRRREPDLYRNGCTQRILALDRCLFNGNLSSQKVDDADMDSSIRDGGKDTYSRLISIMDTMSKSETKPTGVSVMRAVNSFNQLHAVNSFPRKRKRAARFKKNKVLPFKCISNQNTLTYEESETYEESDLLCHETVPYAVENNARSVKDSRVTEKDNQNGLQSPLPNSLLVEIEVTTQSSYEATRDTVEFEKACSFRSDKGDGKSSMEKEELVRNESLCAGNSGFLSSGIDLGTAEVLMAESDVKTTESLEEACAQPKNNNFIKYTFQRKRKKEPLNSPDKDLSVGDNTLPKLTEVKQDVLPDLRRASLITESSTDSGCLVQVAHQLISLSEKKW